MKLVAVITGFHVKTIVVSLVASAFTLGADGTSGSGAIGSLPSSNVVAHAFSDLADSPTSLIAVTLKQYSFSASNPVTVYVVSVTVARTSSPW